MKKIFVVLLIAAFILAGCGVKPAQRSGANERAAPDYGQNNMIVQDAITQAHQESNKNLAGTIDRKIVKNGTIHLGVNDLKETETAVYNLIQEYGGFIQSSSSRNENREVWSEIVARVPFDRFEEFFGRLKQLGRVNYDNISTQDVTEEYIDLSARIKVLKAQEERLISLLAKAEKIDDILRIENELTRLRSDIEQLQGRINYLDRATGYSTVTIRINQLVTAYPETGNAMGSILYRLKDGWITFFNVLIFAVETLAWLSPYIVLAGIFAIVYLKYIKKNTGKGA
ncbi:DUF4349 domain-containing protein [Thermosediminibacter oceani]|uniref:Transmembrane anti-sigma factor n=1 Tax=Thermosediminibacter oceani (strain ATCC BAA-1034 / DSM 16646 / JW/IW-1228P) TaxID=555079 RepID=D9S213_THEOJ|nr:DUF4349 domain-containing protein [Thermosediminibacter oceani]ADL07440.1 putative transmembrane anti-sigma factor [Thermosediminibacter oceani DSM 16646]